MLRKSPREVPLTRPEMNDASEQGFERKAKEIRSEQEKRKDDGHTCIAVGANGMREHCMTCGRFM